MHFTERQLTMLAYLQGLHKPVHAVQLARKFNVGKRTIDNWLNPLCEAGAVHKHCEVKRRPGVWRASRVWFYSAAEKRQVVKRVKQPAFRFNDPFNMGARP